MPPFHLCIKEAAEFILKQVKTLPRHAVLLGSGLKDIVSEFEITSQFSLPEIPHFPVMTVNHMDDTLYAVDINGVPVWIVGGRLHYYEGYSMEQVTFPVRMLAEAGVRSFFLTNAAGNVNPSFHAGDILLIKDHINWSLPSPLIGKNHAPWGDRYPEMIDIYAPTTNQKLLDYAQRSGFQLATGVYLGLTGPQLETPAEYKLFHQLGADMVGMSTIPEVIVAAHMNRQITALSVLTNDASGMPKKNSTTVESILQNVRVRENDVIRLIGHWATL